jgi:DNA-binding response OmpR family regulator
MGTEMDSKTTILIVDDEPINLDFFDVMLTKLGFQVEMAEDGEEALEKVQLHRPDLIILDNIMPKLSGWEVTRILKNHEGYKEYRNVPIIMFSAMDDVKDKVEGFDLGVEDYITKPFNFSEVLARIRAVLRNQELYNQVLQRERRIAIAESLNNSLMYFTRHLKQPVEALIEQAKVVEAKDPKKVEEFSVFVIQECEEVLTGLGALEDEIAELQNKDEKEKQYQVLLEELEEKFQKKFEALNEHSDCKG